MFRFRRHQYEKSLLLVARAVTVGAAYVAVSPIPGFTSAFVAIFTSLLPFDIIVASAHPPIRWEDWKLLFVVLRPRIVSTASTVLKGVAVATVFGVLALLGLPAVAGAVLTVGLSYIWAMSTPYVISTLVAVFAGLALFERLATLEAVETVRIAREIFEVIVSSGGGNFMALMVGWVVGIVTGSVTRLFLSRPYRSLRSAAYDPPLEMRPFKEVLPIGDTSVIVSVTVAEGAPVAGKALADSKLRERGRTTVLSVKRNGEELAMPEGSLVLLPGDELFVLTDREHLSFLYEQLRAPELAASVEVARETTGRA